MKGLYRLVKDLAYPAYRLFAYLLSQERKQGSPCLSRRVAEEKTGQNKMVDLLRPPRIGGDDASRAEKPGPRYREGNISKLSQHMTGIRPVPPIGDPSLLSPGKMNRNLQIHTLPKDHGDGAPGCITVIPGRPIFERLPRFPDHMPRLSQIPSSPCF